MSTNARFPLPGRRSLRAASTTAALGLALLAAPQAHARPGILADWQARYGATSPSGDNAGCQLCHAEASGGSPWNAYGWDIRDARVDLACDLDSSGIVSNAEAFFCVELDNSDADGSGNDNLSEILQGRQPGWTEGPFNTLYSFFDIIPEQLPPDGIGALDLDGTEPPAPPPPPPPGETGEIPEDQITEDMVLVLPGQSIQAALDVAEPGMTVFVRSGTYRELADSTNGLNFTKSGIRLLGEKDDPGERVVIENAGNQRNGMVIVPPSRQRCMSCHSSMEPPFPLRDGVAAERGHRGAEESLTDVEVRGITLRGFRNNGLFTEHLDGFQIVDVRSEDNRNYGIFPTLSRNGVIRDSYARGADDSGIWVETSQNVRVVRNVVEQNVNGFEVSNSDDITLANNEAFGNTVGAAILLLPDIFPIRAGAKRIDLLGNHFHDNNKPNTARPGSVLATVPAGTGILHLGVDDSVIAKNRIENHDFIGIGVVDYCLAVLGSSFTCDQDPTVTPEFVADQGASNNRVTDNVLVNNGGNPDPDSIFRFFASDVGLLTFPPRRNCLAGNDLDKVVSLSFGYIAECD